MATLDTRLESARVVFYLDGVRLREVAKLELKRKTRWIAGRFHYATHPFGPSILIDDKTGPKIVRLHERDELKWQLRRTVRETLDVKALLQMHFGDRPIPHVTATLVNGAVTLRLSGRIVQHDSIVELKARSKWIKGRLRLDNTTGELTLQFARGQTRIDSLDVLSWPGDVRTATDTTA